MVPMFLDLVALGANRQQWADHQVHGCSVRTASGADIFVPGPAPGTGLIEMGSSSSRPVVTSSPNWSHIYSGDSVTIRCDIGQNKTISDNYYYWSKDNKRLQQEGHEITISNAESTDTGDYVCWSGYGDRSHPLTLYVIQKGVPDRPTVTFNPNYRNIFVGEKMVMSCGGESSVHQDWKYVWSRNNEKITDEQKSITINNMNSNNTGDYRCQRGRTASYPLRLHVHPLYHDVILQTPPTILEGDALDLRCHNHNKKKGDTTFYKDGAIIQGSGQMLHLQNVTKSMSGIYRCEKKIKGRIKETEDTFIFVQDLFTRPEILLLLPSVKEIREGDDMTLRCDTRRNPLREDVKLKYTIYRNGQEVHEMGSPDEVQYTVQSAQLEDAGNYTCEVRTLSDTVMKMSDMLYISIGELFQKPEIQIHPERVQEGDNVTIWCRHTERLPYPLFTFYRDSEPVQSGYKEVYVISQASEEHTGNYSCSLKYYNMTKNSTGVIIRVQTAVDKPGLLLLPDKVVVGEDIVLRCASSRGSHPIYYQFYHHETLIGNITVHQMEAAEIQLTVTSLTMGGVYYCAAYNGFPTQPQRSDGASLLVIEPVLGITIITDKDGEDFTIGEALNLTCSAQRGTSISVSWLHNDTVVEESSELYQLEDNGKVLYIPSLLYDHEGWYQCNASNQLSPNRTFSALSNILQVNVLESSNTAYSIPWLMLGIVLLVTIAAVIGLLLLYRGYCPKKTPSTDQNTEEDNESIDKAKTTTNRDVYENMPSRRNPDDEDEGCTYITVKATRAPSPYPAAATGEDFTVVYATVKCAKAASGTTGDQRNPGKSDATNIYKMDNPIYHQYSSSPTSDH
ncbi:Fc receptor-like protein 3 [Dendropsophus ebraccatus]|uniref:Fc receptor-like protein 3 n=1 Tax=Dendropsophus ebraccatus TaxID=150705 RepID=UPI003831A569